MLVRKLTRKSSREQSAFARLLADRVGYRRILSPTATPTLTQNGLLAVLLEQQHRKAVTLAQSSEYRKRLRLALRHALAPPIHALTGRTLDADSDGALIRSVPHYPHYPLKSFTKA